MAELNRPAVEWALIECPYLFRNFDSIHRSVRQIMTLKDGEKAHEQTYELTLEFRSFGIMSLYISLSYLKRRVFWARMGLSDLERQQIAKLAFYFHYQPLLEAFCKVTPSTEPRANFHDPEFVVNEQIDITGIDPEIHFQATHSWFSNDLLISHLRGLPRWQAQYQLFFEEQESPLSVYDDFDWLAFLEQEIPELYKKQAGDSE